MIVEFVKKQQPPGYIFRTECYDRFQIIAVNGGRLKYCISGAYDWVMPGQMIVLFRNSAFCLECPDGSYEGVGLLVDSVEDLLCGEAKVLAPDRGLWGLIDYLAAEIDSPKLERERGCRQVAAVIVEDVLQLCGMENYGYGCSRYWALKVQRALDRNLYTNRSVTDCVAKLGLGSRQLSRHFSAVFGESPKRYQLRCKLAEARRQLSVTGGIVTDIATEMGFSSLQHFSSAFRKQFGVWPRDVLARGRHH